MRKKSVQKTASLEDKSPAQTPLLAILRALDTAEKKAEFAQVAKTSVNYLYQLGTCRRVSCRPVLARSIAAASQVMAMRYKTPVLTFETVFTMCATCKLDT